MQIISFFFNEDQARHNVILDNQFYGGYFNE